MSETKIGWKVIRDYGGIYKSVPITPVAGSVVTYTPQIRAEPRPGCGPLMVFEDFDIADAFVYAYQPWISKVSIWRCEYEQSDETRVWNGPEPYDITDKSSLPAKTSLAKWVTIIEEEQRT